MSEQGLLIETKSASLETMAVTIQALHVNGKQMTLAVFRQLPVFAEHRVWHRNQPTYKPESLAGAWGWVNYAADKRWGTWLVVQRGERLYRTPLCADRLARYDWPNSQKEADRAWADHDKALMAALPQLFIAV